MRRDEIAELLYSSSGLEVECEETPVEMPTSGVLQDTGKGRTYFSVTVNGKTYCYSIAGTGDDKKTLAILAREAATALARKRAVVNPLREFLNGNGGELPVRVGKSDYYVFAVYSASAKLSVYDYLSAMSCGDDYCADMGGGITAFCKKTEGDAYQSAGEFAVVLRENIAEEIEANVKIGVGGVAHGASELPAYYSYATSALKNGAEFDPNNDVYSYKEYALVKILSELPRTVTENYVKTVLDRNYRDVLADTELMTAADEFIRHSLNISEASRSMYVHRNTLIYRLDKIEKATGLNIRNFNDAMSFRIAYLIYKGL